MHRFYTPVALVAGETLRFSAEQSRQIARVLRLQAGDTVEAFDGAGAVASAVLTELGSQATGRLGGVRRQPWPFRLRPALYLALIRPQRFEWAIEKAVEVGVERIVPLITRRVAHGGDRVSAAKLARWRQIAVEAAEQCGSAYVPAVEPPLRLVEALQVSAGLRLIACAAPAAAPLRTIAEATGERSDAGAPRNAAVLIGPEGGFEPAEIEAALAAGWQPVTLGPHTLRSETAAVVALAAIASLAEGGELAAGSGKPDGPPPASRGV